MDELAKRFAELADKYGQNVVDAAMASARTEGLSQLTAGALCLCITAVLVKFARWVWSRGEGADMCDRDVIRLLSVVIGMLALIPACVGVWAFIDPWTWTAISNPELWLAKRAFHL
jgi:hypothetical protein